MNTPSLDSLAVSLDTARALVAAGWDRPTALVWRFYDDIAPAVWPRRDFLRDGVRLDLLAYAPAPTLGELLPDLPPFVHGEGADGDAHGAFWLHVDRYDPAWRAGDPPAGVRLHYRDHDGRVLYLHAADDHAVQYDADCERNPAEAAARLWLALHAAGHIPPKP